MIVIVCILSLVLFFFIAKWFEKCAAEKGYTDDHIFERCFWLWIFGYLYVIALPDRRVQKQNEEIISLLKEIKNGNSDSVPTETSAYSAKSHNDDELPTM